MMLLAFIAPTTARNLILIVVGISYLVYHVVRWSKARSPKSKVQSEIGNREEEIGNREEGLEKKEGDDNPAIHNSSFVIHHSFDPQSSTSEGEELFRRARAMKHQVIPDYRVDGLYLDMLGDAAASGCAAAMAKLGEYAMRRETWVEAYYWMALAKRHGMTRIDAVLRDIRRKWMMAGSPDEEGNVYELFSEESGSIGRALLHIASGSDAANARSFLKVHHPDFLDGVR